MPYRMKNPSRSHFADNPVIHREIRTMLARFGEPSRSRMRAKIGHDRAALRKHETDQADASARHTYREFVVGLHLLRNGFSPEYNRRLDGKTPDWFDERRRLVLEVFTCERGASPAAQRLVSRMVVKTQKYAGAVRALSLAFVIAAYADSLSGFAFDDCRRAITDAGVFVQYPELSGILYFAEQPAGHLNSETGTANHTPLREFEYLPNPNALQPINLPGRTLQ